jgi:hypothetical protein
VEVVVVVVALGPSLAVALPLLVEVEERGAGPRGAA